MSGFLTTKGNFISTNFFYKSFYTLESMQELVKKNLSQWTRGESIVDHLTLSNNLSLKMGSSTPRQQNTKKLGLQFQFQDQDSSSTQYTCQSYPEVASAGNSFRYGESKFSIQSAHGTHEEVNVGSTLQRGTQDYAFVSQADCRQPYACIPLLYPDPYYHGVLSPYGSQMIPHQQGMNVMSGRVPLPLNFSQDGPVFVNAKQYNAILRRRQYRAKLEAQNKLSKPRKPYLHESRHVHALKRARGPGGRFLNLKKIQETQSDSVFDVINVKDESRSASNEVNLFHHKEHKFSIYTSHMIVPTEAGGSKTSGMVGGTHHMFR